MKGIDISNHQPSVDFNALKNSVEVVIMKATEGITYLDSKLGEHYQGAKAAGFPVGFYHFMSEGTSPSEQAVAFYNAIKDKQYEILPCLDIETNNRNRTASQITDRCLEFLAKFKELSGLDCMIYTGGYFGRDNLDNRIKRYKAWIAHYGVNTPMKTGFSNVVGHQYTSGGSVYGINGNVDLNNFNEGIFINKVSIEAPTISQAGQNTYNGYVSGELIQQLQAEINKQFSKGLAVDGLIGPKTLGSLPIVRQGAKGNITFVIQELLKRKGYNINSDGVFGPITDSSIKQFQSSTGISADGVVGPITWSKLLLA
jgi:GH25 family lysozyme M1 (1,4-beta-N-acetylmuramidase)